MRRAVRGACVNAGGPDGGLLLSIRFVFTGESDGESISPDGMFYSFSHA